MMDFSNSARFTRKKKDKRKGRINVRRIKDFCVVLMALPLLAACGGDGKKEEDRTPVEIQAPASAMRVGNSPVVQAGGTLQFTANKSVTWGLGSNSLSGTGIDRKSVV